MQKRDILREIRRLTEDRAGIPPGFDAFVAETGIKQSQWRGVYWARWSDALREAGYEPNQSTEAIPEQVLLGRMADLIRRLGRFPTWAERTMEPRVTPSFPSAKTYQKRHGPGHALALAVTEYCEMNDAYSDVAPLARAASRGTRAIAAPPDGVSAGSVYLIKSGLHYKIGKATEYGRRHREIALPLPERAVTVHVIETDDIDGIEEYWHRRFEGRRKGGEWFALTDADVRAFKRRKAFM